MTITIAISDDDRQRRQQLEQRLRAQQELEVLTDAASACPSQERRLRSRVRLHPLDNALARSERLQPRVLLASLEQCVAGPFISQLQHRCPETRVLILADGGQPQRPAHVPAAQAIHLDAQLLDGLASGACGCLASDSSSQHISQAVRSVERGETWVPRRLLGPLMARLRAAVPLEARPA